MILLIQGRKVRLYPTEEQEKMLWEHIFGCRFLWNYMLNYQQNNYKSGNKYLSGFDMIRLLPTLKKSETYIWLNNVSNASLQTVCLDLHQAYVQFFDGKRGHPKFKSKKNSKNIYPVRANSITFLDGYVKVEKIKSIKIKEKIIQPQKILNPRISYINNKWILSYGIECDNQVRDLSGYSMGIDLGIKQLAVVAYGNQMIKYDDINKTKRIKTLEHKLKHIQRVISRKLKTNGNNTESNGVKKYREIEKEIYYKLANIRHDYIHHITHDLVALLPNTVVMEDLAVSKIMKNQYFAKALQKICLAEFIRQMKYKSEWCGINFIQVDRYYPSSKMCSCCGNIKKDLKLKDRTYHCNKCNLSIDRDYNAALNLMKY